MQLLEVKTISILNKLIYTIVVTYNGMRWIDRCLNSLLATTIPTHILVIDNSSNDGTSEYIKTNFPSVEVISSNVNLGFGSANNIGFQKALDLKADFVFLLNQDASIEPDIVSS